MDLITFYIFEDLPQIMHKILIKLIFRDSITNKMSSSKQKTFRILIQHCINCNLHAWCSRHDQNKYLEHGEQLILKFKNIFKQQNIIFQCKLNQIPSYYHLEDSSLGLNAKYLNQKNGQIVYFPRLGSFEIFAQDMLIFSKLQSNKWPNHITIIQTIKLMIKDFKGDKDLIKYNVRSSQLHDQQLQRNANSFRIKQHRKKFEYHTIEQLQIKRNKLLTLALEKPYNTGRIQSTRRKIPELNKLKNTYDFGMMNNPQIMNISQTIRENQIKQYLSTSKTKNNGKKMTLQEKKILELKNKLLQMNQTIPNKNSKNIELYLQPIYPQYFKKSDPRYAKERQTIQYTNKINQELWNDKHAPRKQRRRIRPKYEQQSNQFSDRQQIEIEISDKDNSTTNNDKIPKNPKKQKMDQKNHQRETLIPIPIKKQLPNYYKKQKINLGKSNIQIQTQKLKDKEHQPQINKQFNYLKHSIKIQKQNYQQIKHEYIKSENKIQGQEYKMHKKQIKHIDLQKQQQIVILKQKSKINNQLKEQIEIIKQIKPQLQSKKQIIDDDNNGEQQLHKNKQIYKQQQNKILPNQMNINNKVIEDNQQLNKIQQLKQEIIQKNDQAEHNYPKQFIFQQIQTIIWNKQLDQYEKLQQKQWLAKFINKQFVIVCKIGKINIVNNQQLIGTITTNKNQIQRQIKNETQEQINLGHRTIYQKTIHANNVSINLQTAKQIEQEQVEKTKQNEINIEKIDNNHQVQDLNIFNGQSDIIGKKQYIQKIQDNQQKLQEDHNKCNISQEDQNNKNQILRQVEKQNIYHQVDQLEKKQNKSQFQDNKNQQQPQKQFKIQKDQQNNPKQQKQREYDFNNLQQISWKAYFKHQSNINNYGIIGNYILQPCNQSSKIQYPTIQHQQTNFKIVQSQQEKQFINNKQNIVQGQRQKQQQHLNNYQVVQWHAQYKQCRFLIQKNKIYIKENVKAQ